MFKSIEESRPAILHLVKPDVTKKFYELSIEQDVFATVDLIRGTGSLARIETISGSYTIKRQGFFMPYVSLRKEKSDIDILTLPLDLQGNAQFSLSGQNYRFAPLNLWKNQWGWVNEKGKVIIKYLPTLSGQVKGDIEIGKDFTFVANLELIAAFGAYLLLQLEDELSLKNN